jgi:hypothetical protein
MTYSPTSFHGCHVDVMRLKCNGMGQAASAGITLTIFVKTANWFIIYR